jgi:hypothetical protein
MLSHLSATSDAVLENALLSDRALKLPLVSLVIVNYNYAAHVGNAIQSIRQQHYSYFECIVVDNASTDDSLATIQRAVADDRRFTVLKLDENIGQLRAVMRVFDRIQGSFVVVVDADDLLFPEFLSSHVQVHLALPAAVSVTSSDIVEIDADDRVLGGGRVGFAANCKPETRGLKTTAAAVRLTTISEADYQRLSDATITVPHWESQWMWAPGTANMFRKHALDVTLPQVSPLTRHVGFEGYFCPILHLMTGSALICHALSAYRIHGRNSFSSAPSMRAARISRGAQPEGPRLQRLAVLHTILSRADTFDVIFAGDRFWSTIDLLPGLYGTTPRGYFANNEVKEVIAENFHSLIKARGARTLIGELAQRFDFRFILELLRTAYENDVPPSLRWALMKGKVRHLRPSLRMARLRWALMKEKVRRLRSSLRMARSKLAAKPGLPNPITQFSAQMSFPPVFKPGPNSNTRAAAWGIWTDGWAEARCGLILAGGDQGRIGVEGTVPDVSPGFRSKLIIRVDEQTVGVLDLEPGDISASWPVLSTDYPRAITLEFAAVQALAPPDNRKAAMLIRAIAVQPDVTSDRHHAAAPSTTETSAPGSSGSGLIEEIIPKVPNGGAATDAPIVALEVVAWRTSLIQETIRWANERRPTRKACNICGFSGYFQPHWFPVRPEAKCPQCSSLERHRLVKLWFDDHVNLFNGARVLHFAAEIAMTRFIKPICQEYVTADIQPRGLDIELDIEALDLTDSRFEIVVCSHALEHVDDRRALSELYRVITPSGFALLMFPIVEGWTTTYEDSSKRTVEERWQHFGQGDHVRRYGSDVRQRIVDAGFLLEEFTAVEPYVARHALLPGEKLFIAKKNKS